MNTYLLIISFFLSTIAHYFLLSKKGETLYANRKTFKISIFIFTFFQLLTAFLYVEKVTDVYLFKSAGNYLRQRIDFYWIDSDHTQYPFFPFLIFMHAGLDYMSETVPYLTFMFLIKSVLLIPLHYLAYWVQSNAQTALAGRKKYLELITSPIIYAVIFFHGQIDIILIAFFILSITYLEKKDSYKNMALSAVLFAASIASKTWSIVFSPLLLWHKRKDWKIIPYFLFTGFLLLTNVFLYTRYVDGSSVSTVLPALLKPGGPIGIWGITLLPPVTEYLMQHKLLIYALLLGVGYLLVIRTKYSRIKILTLFIMWLYIVSIHWAVQYLIWIIPFTILFSEWLGKKWVFQFHLVASIYVLLNYINVANNSETINRNIIMLIGVYLFALLVTKFIEKIKQPTML